MTAMVTSMQPKETTAPLHAGTNQQLVLLGFLTVQKHGSIHLGMITYLIKR
jgi:hypothetical protein